MDWGAMLMLAVGLGFMYSAEDYRRGKVESKRLGFEPVDGTSYEFMMIASVVLGVVFIGLAAMTVVGG